MTEERLKLSKSVTIVKILIDIVWYLGWFVSLLAILLVVFIAAGGEPTMLHQKVPVVVSYVEDIRDALPISQRPYITEVRGRATIHVEPYNVYQKWLICMTLPIVLIAFLMGVRQLRLFFNSVKAGNPFDPLNPGRLRRLGYIIVFCEPLFNATFYLQGLLSINQISLPGAKISLFSDIDVNIIFLGFVIIVIGQIFDIAAKMHQEQELTI